MHLAMQPQSVGLAPVTAPDSVRASVGHLLSRASALPCSTSAQAFSQLVQPTSRFQLALDSLLPVLDLEKPSELSQRILACYILYSLYAPHPIYLNPFKSVFYLTYLTERERAVNLASAGETSPNEQLVWVLWKILKGDGEDIGPYSPSTLAQSPLPPKLRANNLTLDDSLFKDDPDDMTTKPGPAEQDANSAHAIQLLFAARERVLTIPEQRIVIPLIPIVAKARVFTSLDLEPLISYNPTIAYPLFAALLSSSGEDLEPYLHVLVALPPRLQSFDLVGKLLRDQTTLGDTSFTVAQLIRETVLGQFIHECIAWLDAAAHEERSDDIWALGVRHLCRFFTSLIKLSIVDVRSEIDTAEMTHFSLAHARFEEANTLYRYLVQAKSMNAF